MYVELWAIGGILLLGCVAYLALLFAIGRWREGREQRRRDERRHSEQLEWLRRRQAGEALPTRYETVYKPDEMVDEDVARMAELGYYVADEIVYTNGDRKLVYRLEGVSAL